MKVLLADDERELTNALAAILKHNRYTVDIADNGEDALLYGKTGDYGVIILDIMMPKMDGLSVLKELRKAKINTPVLMLTAKSEIEDKIIGLDMGADDYLSKPFAMGELLARIRAMTRRKAEITSNLVQVGNLTLNKDNFELSTEKERIRLSSKEYQMMEMFMDNPERLFSTEQFMEKIWGYDSESEINVVWVYISYLRKKLAVLEANVEIKAFRGTGYMLI